MQLLFFGITGLSLGIVAASLRVPKVRMFPLLAAGVLAAVAVGGLLYVGAVSVAAQLVFIATSCLSSPFYSARLWQHERIDPSATYWGWVQREFFHPSYGRRLYAQSGTAVR